MAELIAFYSRADENYFGGTYRYIEVGNTEKAANMIAELTGADLFKIEQKVPYAAVYQTCIEQAQADKRANARPELVSMPENMDAYDEIYLGYPNYWGTMPMAVFTFLEQINWEGRKIHPFCTHEGSGMGSSVRDLKNCCVGADITEGLAIHGSDVDHAGVSIKKWIDRRGK